MQEENILDHLQVKSRKASQGSKRGRPENLKKGKQKTVLLTRPVDFRNKKKRKQPRPEI